jgi:hypothetical protein
MKSTHLAIAAVAVVGLAVAWKKDKLNKVLPEKLQHREGFIGLNRSGQYVTARGGGPGIPGTDPNTSDWL